MKEIRQLTGQGLAYRSREELTASLSALYDIVHTEGRSHLTEFQQSDGGALSSEADRSNRYFVTKAGPGAN